MRPAPAGSDAIFATVIWCVATIGCSGFGYMHGKLRSVPVLVLATLIVVAGCSMLTPRASGNGVDVLHLTLNSIQYNGATANLGSITIVTSTVDPLPGTLMAPGPYPKGPLTLTYTPAPGYYFVMWIVEGPITISDLNAQSTTVTFLSASQGTITAIYQKIGQLVGGVVTPTNTLTVLAPYLAVIGLVAVGAVICVKKRRR